MIPLTSTHFSSHRAISKGGLFFPPPSMFNVKPKRRFPKYLVQVEFVSLKKTPSLKARKVSAEDKEINDSIKQFSVSEEYSYLSSSWETELKKYMILEMCRNRQNFNHYLQIEIKKLNIGNLGKMWKFEEDFETWKLYSIYNYATCVA